MVHNYENDNSNSNSNSNNNSRNNSRSNSLDYDGSKDNKNIVSSSSLSSSSSSSSYLTSSSSMTSTTTPLNDITLANNTISFINLPLEIIDSILHLVGQSTLRSASMVSKQWNVVVNSLWHTIDLSKSHNHLTHISSKLNQLKQQNNPTKQTRKKEKVANKQKKQEQDDLYMDKTSSDHDNIVVTLPTSSTPPTAPTTTKKLNSLESIIQNMILNYGFLIPGSGPDSTSPPIFQRQMLRSKKVQQDISIQLDVRIERFFSGLAVRYCRVEVLDLSGCVDMKLESLSTLAQAFSSTLTKLVTRRCRSTSMVDADFADQVISYLPKLETLAIGEMPYIGDKTIERAVSIAPSLKALGLGKCLTINDQAIAHLVPIASRIKTIGLNNLTQLSDLAVRSLGVLCQNIVIFSISNMKHLSSDTLSAIALACPRLGSFDIGGCDNVDDNVLEAIASNCHQLFQFNISKCTLVSSHAIDMVIQRCRQIKILFLSKTAVDDDCILNAIDILPLEILISIGCSNLTDRVLQSLFKIGNERLSKMIVSLNSCPHISDSLLSILQHLTKQSNNSCFTED
ncbi:hypothetical protein DFA_03207 [Cavenderia fasciculata]|uniref:F-box domain-containing protein n=1 Tax=Cavenderia fasciculata TaxID=261658 RepID=F4PGX8_CACFS|nr:uncharacterized protein DFA_03207 [Cavenderia fasciculata]EGG24962.1 hypothetical protein DFA_03207 [Cavenderia fasciculata]|eukprot:XP_004362813.1 hypothetical protein DFA_03207 [Cavenderia fasciculata]